MENTKKLFIKSGELLIGENDSSRKLFILRKGKVRVYKKYMGGKVTLAILGPGQIFGELSFFDSKPRSASVEAITDITVDCIDGDQLESQINSLPKWVHLVFDCVATRFRDIDQKMAVYKSLSDFQRKTLSSDSVGNAIYSELLRMTKILKMILREYGNPQNKDTLKKELSQTLGETHIDSKGYLRVLLKYEFIHQDHYENRMEYKVDEQALEAFEYFLKEKFEQDTCNVLGHYALGLIRKIITFIDDDTNAKDTSYKLPDEAIEIDETDEDTQAAFQQLKRIKLIRKESNGIYVDPAKIIPHYKYYSMIKSFDHTVIFAD